MEEQIEKWMGTLEGRMSELAAELERKDNLARERALDLQLQEHRRGELNSNFARSIRELNADIQRLYSQSFGALVEDSRAVVEERQSPDGGWYQEQEFHRFSKDGGKTWRECSMLKGRVHSQYRPYECDLVKRGQSYAR